MSVHKSIEPKQVFRFFEEISLIPRGSGNTKAVSDYCVKFAQDRGLEYYQDKVNNVIIKKPGTKGYENSEPLIVQGHLDMVNEKESGVKIDFETQGLDLYVDGDFLKARGTTLGGDNGVAVAYSLAILDSKDLAHPPIEAVFTVDEEIGMLGAAALETSLLKGKRMLNIDSTEEGIFLVGCAGGITAEALIPVSYRGGKGKRFELIVHGLLGGHSGVEIHKERANAVVILVRALKKLDDHVDIQIESLQGGRKDNAIPREATAVIRIKADEEERVLQLIQRLEETLKKEFRVSDPGIALSFRGKKKKATKVLDPASTLTVLFFLRNFPYGVQNQSMDVPGMVETSLNPGIVLLDKKKLSVSSGIRSSVKSRKYDVLDRIRFLAESFDGEVNTSGDYSAWEYRANSPLRDLMIQTYEDLSGEKAQVYTIHAGLECGILSDKIKDLDAISFGPNIYDIHTPMERLSISSTEKVWRLIVEFLKRAK